MAKVTRKLKGSSKVMEQSNPSTKQLISSKGKNKMKKSCQSRARKGGKVKKIQREIKRLLHGSSRKKSSGTSTEIPKVKRVKRAKKFRPLAKIE
uniref:Uncharacterized protein n=1 Tax=Pongo abelii TaxID=9601 RepID=A0A8I5TI62_PONAB